MNISKNETFLRFKRILLFTEKPMKKIIIIELITDWSRIFLIQNQNRNAEKKK